MKKLLLLAMLSVSLNSYAIQVQGHIIDAESKLPIEGVTVVLTQTDSIPVYQSATQKDGFFAVQTPAVGSYYLMISCIGYVSSTIAIENIREKLDLGNIELLASSYDLAEVTVSASDYTRIDRQIIFPSAQVVAHSFNGLDVLSKLVLPGILVNTITNSVSTTDNRFVQVRINNVAATVSDVLAINSQHILKVEFIDMPGLRYGNAGAVINFVLKKRGDGVSTGGNSRTALNTGYTDNMVYLKYNNKLSEFGVNYQYGYTNYKNYFKEEQQTLQLPGNPLQLTKEGIKAPYKTIRHNIALSYNWNNNEKTIVNILLRNNIERPTVTTKQFVNDGLNNIKYSSFLKTKDKSYIPSLDLYFQHSFDERQTIIANALTTYISSDYKRTYREHWEDDRLKSDFSYNTDGTKYSLVSEVIYENIVRKNLIFLAGIQYSRSHLENTYTQRSDETVNTMNTSDLHGYIQLQGSFNKFGYLLGAGYSRQYFHEGGGKYSRYLFRPTITLSYSPQQNMMLRYYCYLLPAIPGLSDLSDYRQWQNEYEVFVGNPNLKPYHSYGNMLSFNYRKGRISLSPSIYYQYNSKPIMNTIDLGSEDGEYYIVYSNDNQKNYQHLQARLYATLTVIKDRLDVTAFGVINRFFNFGNTYTHCLTNNFGGFQLNGSYGNWSLLVSMAMASKMVNGETLSTYSPTSSASIRYRHKKVQYGIDVMNLFRPEGNPAKQEVISKYVQKKSATYTKDQGNMVRFTLAWNLDFGRKYNAKQKKIDKYLDTNSGIIK